jgi:hypothetical protein
METPNSTSPNNKVAKTNHLPRSTAVQHVRNKLEGGYLFLEAFQMKVLALRQTSAQTSQVPDP